MSIAAMGWFNDEEVIIRNDLDVNDMTLYGLFVVLVVFLGLYYVRRKCKKLKDELAEVRRSRVI